VVDRRAFFALAAVGAGATLLQRLTAFQANRTFNVLDYGARGDGWTDDTEAFQTAVDSAARIRGGGAVIVPRSAGEYVISGVDLRSDVALELDAGAVVRARPELPEHRAVLRIRDVQNVRVVGGVLDGSRQQQEAGEHRHGIEVRGSKDIVIRAVAVRDCAGDGVYIGSSARRTFSSNVHVVNCALQRNRRQGISLISGRSVVIEGVRITDTRGTAPQAGLDIEPNEPREILEGIRVRDLFTARNAGGGILIALGRLAEGSAPPDIVISGHVSVDDEMGMRTASMPVALSGRVVIEDTWWIRPGTHGFLARNWSADGPAIEVNRATVIDANQQQLASERYGAAVAVYKSGDDPPQPPVIGNVLLRHMHVSESRGSGGASWAFYLRNDVDPAAVSGVMLIAPTIHGVPQHRHLRRSPAVVVQDGGRL
jgi:hypothetical protein